MLKGDDGARRRDEHFIAVEILRHELDRAGIDYKTPERPSHVTAVRLGSAERADAVMSLMSQKGYYVQGKLNFWVFLVKILKASAKLKAKGDNQKWKSKP